MTIISTKTGIMSIANIVISSIIIITIGIGATTASSYRGTWVVVTCSSGEVLLIAACVSLILHTLIMLTNIFMGDGEVTVPNTNYFLANQVLLALLFGCSSFALLVYWGSLRGGNRHGNSFIAAGSFGIIGTLTHAATAFLAKTTL